VLGAGIAAGGWLIADWGVVGRIAASWVMSPVLGGQIAAMFLYIIKRPLTYQPDLMAAAQKMAPILIALMGWAFTTYLMMKGLKKILPVGFLSASIVGLVIAVGIWALMRHHVAKTAPSLSNDKNGVNELFTIPLIFAAALLSFAHGANDVANAVGPLAGISEAIMSGAIGGKAAIPLWVMMVGAAGIVLGLALYGPKLIRTVGSEITELDKARAFCVALAAAITVIIASQLGLPVSSTHIAVGAVFGVGFFREWHAERRARNSNRQKMAKPVAVEERRRRKLVRRSHFMTIVAAWIITVPASACLSAVAFFVLNAIGS
jgi:PiT family inorganic phosphate transporter